MPVWRLENETGRAADALGEGGLELSVAELGHLQVAQLDVVHVGIIEFVDLFYNLLCEIFRRPAAEKFHLVLSIFHNQRDFSTLSI